MVSCSYTLVNNIQIIPLVIPNSSYLLLVHIAEVDLDLHFELSPASLRHLERRLLYYPQSTGVGLVQLELHLLDVLRDVLVVEGLKSEF